jgi:hypothetical protein
MFRQRWRWTGARWRLHPDFVIIGAQKSGTTSLYKYMVQHPSVLAASKKEVHYFDIRYQNGDLWYRSHFPFSFITKKNNFITGEASPYYIFHPYALARMRQVVPKAKIIILLRNPIDRAISHFFHEKKRNREVFSLEKAFQEEEKRISLEYTKMLEDQSYNSRIYKNYSYKKRGVYIDQLKLCYQFFPKEQVLVLKSEDFFLNPVKILKSVFLFLEIDPDFRPQYLEKFNVGSYTDQVPQTVIRDLRDYFSPHNQRLYQYLNFDFGW